MEAIKIEVTGNIARVTQKPTKLTSGTVGLPVEFTFDEQWDGLKKMAVFRAGDIKKTVDIPEGVTTVPWEVMDKPKVWLSTGVYGINDDGTVVIPTIWANVSVIRSGVDLEGDDPTDPEAPIWKDLTVSVNEAIDNANKAAGELREAIENGEIDVPGTVKTVNGIEPDENGNVDVEGDANVMIVSCQDGERSNYLPSQIFAHVQAGGIAMLHLGSMCINLSWVSEYFAMFSEYNDDYCHYANIIYEDGRYERLEMFHAQGEEIWNYCEELSNAIGNLPEALDRIIEIQEELIGV